MIDVQFPVDGRPKVRRTQVSPELLLVYTPPYVVSTAANFVPSALEATDLQLAVIAGVLVQLTPESALFHIPPPSVAVDEHATKFVPFESDAIIRQAAVAGNPELLRVHELPESMLVYIPPAPMTAANFFPSALEVIENQFAVVGNPVVLLTHVLPELVLTYIFPVSDPPVTNAAVEPSALKTILLAYVSGNPTLLSAHVLPESLLTNSPAPDAPDASAAIFVPSALEVID